MKNPSDFLKQAREAWSNVRSFGGLWLALTNIGGFLVLIGGHWMINLLVNMFGPKAGHPGWVIMLLVVCTLPIAVYLWIYQRRLENREIPCSQCGEKYPPTKTSCPMCGCTNSAKTSPPNPSPNKTATANS